MTRAELILKLAAEPRSPVWALSAITMLEADGEYRQQSHEATVCREVARQQTDTVNRLSAENDDLTAKCDEARALLAELEAQPHVQRLANDTDHRVRDLWARLQEAVSGT